MSNYLAIATVTMALRDILQNAAQAAIPGANVTVRRPENVGNDGQDKAGINLFLYQVTPNPAWTNTDLPTRNFNGQLVQRPQVALDLYYLLSFHGSELEMEPQRLLGSTTIALHTQPILTPEVIRSTVANTSYLAMSNLAEQGELVKFAPLNLSLEELSKLWSVFFQVPYTLSMIYRASVVLIEAEVDVLEVKIVTERGIHVRPEVP